MYRSHVQCIKSNDACYRPAVAIDQTNKTAFFFASEPISEQAIWGKRNLRKKGRKSKGAIVGGCEIGQVHSHLLVLNMCAKCTTTCRRSSASAITSASTASGPKRSRSPETLEEAWRRHCKLSTAGSHRAACRYAGGLYVPPKLREFAAGGRWYKTDPPLKPMSSVNFEKWCAD